MKILLFPFHDDLTPNQWIISRWSIISIGWKISLILFIGLTSIPSTVVSRDVDYFYHHRAYRQNVLPNLRRNQPVVVETPADDYTVDNNFEKTQFKLRSSNDGGDGEGNNLISGLSIGKDNGVYAFGLDDTYSASLKALDTDSNENLNRQSQPKQLQSDDQNGALSVSSFVKHTPKPSSQLKASSFNVDSSPPMKMFARASASASSRIHGNEEDSVENLLFVGSVIGVTFIGIFLVIATGYFVHRINIQRRAAADVEYPAYGVVGPGVSLKEKDSSSGKSTSGTSKGSTSGTVTGTGSLSPSGDRRLAQSAQMYHYHHQKQQMISSDKVVTETGQRPSTSEMDSEEEENEEGDYTVYECPGLASTGEMEVKNPLFQDDITPISSPSVRDTK